MNQIILVTYASRFGSTTGVAQAVNRTLSDSGIQVDVLSMRDIKDLSAYDAIVAGSAITGGAWLSEAMPFVCFDSELPELAVSQFL